MPSGTDIRYVRKNVHSPMLIDTGSFCTTSDHALVAKVAFAEIEAREALEHQPVAFERWFVEAVQRLELRELLRVDAGVRTQPERHRALLRRALAQFLHGLFDGAARHELDHRERGQHADERRDHQQQAFEDVAPHRASTRDR